MLLLISTITDYVAGYLVYSFQKKALKRLVLILSLVMNLGLLGYFKYAYFFADAFQSLSGHQIPVINYLSQWMNALSGSRLDISVIILPVGISFYTFQSISYTIDIYRNKLTPVRNFFDFAFYVSFFPQLVAGPIVRAAHFIPQIYKRYSLSIREAGHALFLIMSGLIKKLLFSDTLATHLVDRIFEDPAAFTGVENLLASYGYSLQIYFDFSGYTDIAIGVALLFGFRLPINFNAPYKALSPTDFWRRWHISLSSWLRDYLYIPLGGNRKGRLSTSINILITMLLGGLWHGASIKFIIWGGLHGAGLLIHKAFQGLFGSSGRPGRFIRFIQMAVTFHFVTILWLVFRADSWNTAVIMMKQILFGIDLQLVPEVLRSYILVVLLMISGFILQWLPSGLKEQIRGQYIKIPIIFKAFGFVLLFFILYQVISADLRPFIYFRF